MKWFVFGYEVSDATMGNDILGYVETAVEDLTDAKRFAQIKFGAKNVAFVARASHMERVGGKLTVIYD